VPGDQHLDLVGGDVLATAADGLLLAVDEIKVAVLVQPAAIARVQPEVAHIAHRGLGHLVVARHDDATLARPHADLADFARRQRIVLVADDLQLG